MNILFLVKNTSMGGVLTSMEVLAGGLIKDKHANVVIGANKAPWQETRLRDHKVIIIDFNSRNPVSVILNYIKIKKIIAQYDIDIIHAQNRVPALYAFVYCKFHKNIPYIWTNHLVPVPSSWIYRKTTKYGYKAVTDSQEGKIFLEKDLRIPPDKIKVINLGMDLSSIRRTSAIEQVQLKQKLGIQETEKVIILYGRLDEKKGHLFLLNCISRCSQENYRLIFPGENEEFKCTVINRARELGLAEKLIFPGYIKGNEYLSISDLLVLPSKSEGLPMALIEAFCLKVPVIRSATGGYKDMQDMCFGVDYGDENRLTELLESFFNDEAAFKEKAEYAYSQRNRFDVRRTVEQYYDLYTEATGK